MPSLHDLAAPAKINLFLHVTGRRDDGYHLLQSVFMLLDWHDTLHIETRTDGAIRRHDLNVALPDDDLCLRAARLLQQQSGTALGADIHVFKRLPWGAGLGGGSSDAATALLALNQLWSLHWPRQRLEQLAVQLGADVAFFVRGHTAWVEGIGEVIEPITLPQRLYDTPLVLLKPPIAVPTGAIFGSPSLKRDTPHARLSVFLAAPECFGRNDLEPPAIAYSDEQCETGTGQIRQALTIMQNRFGNSRMSGSGSTVFAWAQPTQLPPQQADHLIRAADLGLDDPAWVGRVCRGLSRHPLLDVLQPLDGDNTTV